MAQVSLQFPNEIQDQLPLAIASMACNKRVSTSAPSFFKQELAHFSNDQRFVYYEHVVVSVMQFDDSRVLHARAEDTSSRANGIEV